MLEKLLKKIANLQEAGNKERNATVIKCLTIIETELGENEVPITLKGRLM